jgi:uncharacterized protein
MDERGAPTPVAWTRLRAPESLMGPADATAMEAAVEASPGYATYSQVVDRESASEKLAARMTAGAEKQAREQGAKDTAKPAPAPKAAKPQDSTFEKVVKSSTFQYAVKYAAREAVRGMFGIGRR